VPPTGWQKREQMLLFRSEPSSRLDPVMRNRGGKSELRMAAGWVTPRRGNPTESATESKPPIPPLAGGKGEMAGQEPTVPGGDIGMHGKPPAEQDQIREDSPRKRGARRPGTSYSRVGRSSRAAMLGPDKWLLLPSALRGQEKTEFGLSAHSISSLPQTAGAH